MGKVVDILHVFVSHHSRPHLPTNSWPGSSLSASGATSVELWAAWWLSAESPGITRGHNFWSLGRSFFEMQPHAAKIGNNQRWWKMLGERVPKKLLEKHTVHLSLQAGITRLNNRDMLPTHHLWPIGCWKGSWWSRIRFWNSLALSYYIDLLDIYQPEGSKEVHYNTDCKSSSIPKSNTASPRRKSQGWRISDASQEWSKVRIFFDIVLCHELHPNNNANFHLDW